jgi:hypothetical protein
VLDAGRVAAALDSPNGERAITEALPQLDWSSRIREAAHADHARRIAADHDGTEPARTAAATDAFAYFYAAWVVEEEHSDGRGSDGLATAGEAFLDELLRAHGLDEQ